MRYAVFVLLILAGATGCATVQAADTRSSEQMRAAAGFHMELADTPERVATLQSLPERQLLLRPKMVQFPTSFRIPPVATACTLRRTGVPQRKFRLSDAAADMKVPSK